MRKIHFSRLLDIISGSALAGASTKVQKSSLYKDFDIAKLEGKKLRDLIDRNLPTFYVVNIDLIVKEINDSISPSFFKDNEEYVQSTVFSDRSKLHKAIADTVKKTIHTLPKKPFKPILDSLDDIYNKALDTLSKRSSYIGFRNVATSLGAQVRGLLKQQASFIATDAASIIELPNSNSVLIIGPTFEYTKSKVNDLINEAIRNLFEEQYEAALKKYDPKNQNNTFSVGNLVNAGHTAAFSTGGDLIGVNMPALQEVQFLMSSAPNALDSDKAISDLYLDSGYAIKFKQNFTGKAGALLDLQFSFVVSMPSTFNTNTLRVNEVRNINKFIGDTILPTIAEQAKDKFKGGLIDLIPDVGASPSIREFIEKHITDIISGKNAYTLVKDNKATAKGTSIPIPILKKTGSVLSKTKVKISTGGLHANTKTAKSPKQSSLSSLQALLDKHLQDVISANMGNGNDRKILNYRTGRFAASAKVERLSQSRDGAITAYYTYMKNPYATFSQGGRQQYPRSRDPKLLISQSIREIAATVAANRLRAVLV